jgi:hypothetical protein
MHKVGKTIIKELRWKQVVYAAFLNQPWIHYGGFSRSNFKML